MVRFHAALSEQSVHSRYFHAMKLDYRVAHGRLRRICFIDYDREMALVADGRDPATGAHEILAVGRLSKFHGRPEAEFALIVRDGSQGQGLGSELLRRLIQVGRDDRLRHITADILPENGAMQRLCERLGFRLRHDARERVVRAEIELNPPGLPGG